METTTSNDNSAEGYEPYNIHNQISTSKKNMENVPTETTTSIKTERISTFDYSNHVTKVECTQHCIQDDSKITLPQSIAISNINNCTINIYNNCTK